MGEIETRAKLRILDYISNPVVIHDAIGKIYHANLAALNFFGLPNLSVAQKENIIGRFSTSLPAAEDFIRRIKQVSELGPANFEWQTHIPGDRVRTMAVQSSLLSDWEDQEAYLSHFLDITSVKGVVEALHESESKFRFIAENSEEVIWHTDKELRFTYISPSDQKIRGYTSEELLGQSFLKQLTSEGEANVSKATEIRMEDEGRGVKTGAASYELQQVCKDGRLLWTEVNINPYRDTAGNLIGYHGVTRDITDGRQVEEQLKNEKARFEKIVEELRKAREDLEYLANYDSLTGLMNRRCFQETTEKEIKRAMRYNHPLTMVMMDFDNFKMINDTYGHPVGDEVLVQIAKLLQDALRQHDIAARMSGDEFVLLLPETEQAGALLFADRVRDLIVQQVFEISNGAEISLTCSLGVAEFDPEDGSFITLYRIADEALYKAKSMGKNRVEAGGFIR